MLSFIRRLFKIKSSILPCYRGGECPYEYDKDSDREIEGMPFAKNDPRSCPTYGHVCPKFMEDFGLTIEDLRIRATIHCGELMMRMIKDGRHDPDDPMTPVMLQAYKETLEKYPLDKFPQYYA